MVSACASSFTPSSFNPEFIPAPRQRFAMTPLGALQAMGASCTRAEILTYTALELHADKDTGFCNPGRETLAGITGLPENRITKATSSLEKKGFIRKEQPDPFHVHYYLLTPPVVEPVEPRARFRPPLKARPVEPVRPVPSAEPAPAPKTSAAHGTDPCHQRHELVPPAEPLTDQWTDQKEKREPTTEPERIEPAPQPQAAHSVPLRSTKTGVPDAIPEVWLEQAGIQRPDLTADTIRKSAGIFIDNHRAKGTLLVDWSAAFRVWIARERAPKAPQTASAATQPANRYAHLDAKETPVSAAVRAALDAGEQNRIAMLIANGIDPITGFKSAPPATTALPDGDPIPQGRKETDQEYDARFEQHRKFQLERLAKLMAEREGKG